MRPPLGCRLAPARLCHGRHPRRRLSRARRRFSCSALVPGRRCRGSTAGLATRSVHEVQLRVRRHADLVAPPQARIHRMRGVARERCRPPREAPPRSLHHRLGARAPGRRGRRRRSGTSGSGRGASDRADPGRGRDHRGYAPGPITTYPRALPSTATPSNTARPAEPRHSAGDTGAGRWRPLG